MCEHAPTARSVLVCADVPTDSRTLAVLVATAAEFGGTVSRFPGGRVAVTFRSATSAMAAAIEMERAAVNCGLAGLAFGLAHGDVEHVRGLGPVGVAPYLAGQLSDRCHPGEIAVTNDVVDQLAAPLPAATVSTLTTVVAGLDGRQLVHVVTPRTAATGRIELAQAIARPTANSAP